MDLKKTEFVREFNAKDHVKSIFVIKHITMMRAKDGRNYLNIVLGDKTGEMEARKWQDVERVFKEIARNDYVYIDGKVNQFQNRLQIIISEITKCDAAEVDSDQLIEKAASAPEEMYERLLKVIDTLDDVYIKDLLTSILSESEIKRRLYIWQAGKTIHHSYQSGLLEHTLSCAELASTLAAHYKVNRNYVVAGAVLHDVCKIYELSDGAAVDYTEEGRLLGHVIKVVELVDRFCQKISNFPYQTRIHLKHILLSHHGEYEFGSPKIPKTSEALLVHYIDLLDSKMNSFETIKKNDSLVGDWSGYVKHLDRMIYKGELPHHPEYLEEEAPVHEDEKTKRNEKKGRTKAEAAKELKHNLADQLKNFKLK